MDRSKIIEALTTAKGIIMSHGIASYMTNYNKTRLSSPISGEASAFRAEFHLDTSSNSYSNPSCSVSVTYRPSPTGPRMAEDGSYVHDYTMDIVCSTSSSDIKPAVMKARENMIGTLLMLCDMLESVLPSRAVALIETAEEHVERKKRELEQAVGYSIHTALGDLALRGLRSGGRSRFFHTPTDLQLVDGSYRYKHVRKRNARGHVTDSVSYLIRVSGGTTSVRRVE